MLAAAALCLGLATTAPPRGPVLRFTEFDDAIARARRQLREGPGLEHCEECDAPIPLARRQAVPGVRLCVACQQARDDEDQAHAGYNRRGSKDSQLR